MLGWIVRGLLIVAGFVASWFVAKDAPQFGIMQMAVALFLFVLVVAVLTKEPNFACAPVRRRPLLLPFLTIREVVGKGAAPCVSLAASSCPVQNGFQVAVGVNLR